MVQMKNTKWLKEEEYDTLFANLDDIVKINSRLYTHLMVILTLFSSKSLTLSSNDE